MAPYLGQRQSELRDESRKGQGRIGDRGAELGEQDGARGTPFVFSRPGWAGEEEGAYF